MAILGVVFIRMVMTAQAWPDAARLFPTITGVAMSGLLVVAVLKSLREMRREDGTSEEGPLWEGVEPRLAARRVSQTVIVIAGTALLVWLLGFPIGGPLALALQLLVIARERVAVSIAITAGSVAALWALSNLLNVRFFAPFLPFVTNPF